MTREQKAILAATPGLLLKEEFLDVHQLSQSRYELRIVQFEQAAAIRARVKPLVA